MNIGIETFSFEWYQADKVFLARLHEVRVPVPFHSCHTVFEFSKSHILTSTYQKAFILGPYILCRVSFYTMTSDPRVHAQGWG